MILANFLVGLPMTLLCLVVQTTVSYWCVRRYVRQSTGPAVQRGFIASIRPLLIAMLAMMVGNLVQVMLWGSLFVWLGEFGEFYDAVYHSAVNFTSLGYGDVVMNRKWKFLGPLEALDGVLMLGMTAAALMAILQRMVKLQVEAVVGRGQAETDD
jgi:hypothetical protein